MQDQMTEAVSIGKWLRPELLIGDWSGEFPDSGKVRSVTIGQD
jgi:hypothetical protein